MTQSLLSLVSATAMAFSSSAYATEIAVQTSVIDEGENW
jgi:hypothetical protein